MTVHNSKTLQEWTRYLFPDEVGEIKRLANLLRENPTVVNFGAGNGTSGMAFIEARPDLKLVTIDIMRHDSPFGCLLAEETHLRDAGYWDTREIEHFHSDSARLGRVWVKRQGRGKVDMVFVDGGHVAPQPEQDILAWLPNIRKGGIIAVHDYKKNTAYKPEHTTDNTPHPKPWPDVDDAVDRLLVPKFERIGLIDTLISFRVK